MGARRRRPSKRSASAARTRAICLASGSIRRSSPRATPARPCTAPTTCLPSVPAQQLRERARRRCRPGSGRGDDRALRQGHRADDRQAAVVGRRGSAAGASDRRAFGPELRRRRRQGPADRGRHRGAATSGGPTGSPDGCRREQFRCYSTDDLVGVEVGGALKNVLAIAAGTVVRRRSRRQRAGRDGDARLRRAAPHRRELRRAAGDHHGPFRASATCCSPAAPRSRAISPMAWRSAAATRSTAGRSPKASRRRRSPRASPKERGIDAPIIRAIDICCCGAITVDEAVSNLMTRPLRSEDE